MSLKKFFIRVWNTYISCSTHTFYIIRKPISYSNYASHDISSIHHYFIFFRTTKINRSRFLHISKNHKKKRITKKRFCKLARLIIDQFYLLISLEGMWSFIRSLILVLVPFRSHFGTSTYIMCKPQPQNHKQIYHLKVNSILVIFILKLMAND